MSDKLVEKSGKETDSPTRRTEDQRCRLRHTTSMPATIVLSPYDHVPCVIRDLSDGGAKLGLSRRHVLPNRFWIIIRHADVTRRASLMWRRGEFAGIAFDQPFG